MKNRRIQWLVLAVVVAMLAMVAAGCGGGDKKPAAPAKADATKISGKLMIYTSIYPDIIEGVKPAIKKAFPDLDVQWFQAGTEKVITKLLIENNSQNQPVNLAKVGNFLTKRFSDFDVRNYGYSKLSTFLESLNSNDLGQFTRNYTQTVKRAADNKRRYAPGWVHSTCLLRGFPKGAAPHLAHDFAEQSVVCYTLCRRCPENTVAAGEGKGI